MRGHELQQMFTSGIVCLLIGGALSKCSPSSQESNPSAAAGYSGTDAARAGSGNGGISYSVSPNTSTASRNGTLTVAGQTFSVAQAGATPTCTYSLSSSGANPGAAASSGTFTLNVASGCSWSVSSSAPGWLSFGPPSGSSTGVVIWTATANTSCSARSATLAIAGQSLNSSYRLGGRASCKWLSALTRRPVRKEIARQLDRNDFDPWS